MDQNGVSVVPIALLGAVANINAKPDGIRAVRENKLQSRVLTSRSANYLGLVAEPRLLTFRGPSHHAIWCPARGGCIDPVNAIIVEISSPW